MQERRPTKRAKRRGRKRVAFSVVALGLVFAAHHQLASLENASMAALEESSAAKKIGARAARSAALAVDKAAHGVASRGFEEIENADRVSLPGPAAAGLAMQLSRDPALQARFRQLQKETASALNTASRQGKDLSTLRTPLPAVLGGRALKQDSTR